jgi:hypothetical protein
VAVEKLFLWKMPEKTLRQDALQTTFLVFLDIFYPPNFGCFGKNGVFQQPQALALIDPARTGKGVLSAIGMLRQLTSSFLRSE